MLGFGRYARNACRASSVEALHDRPTGPYVDRVVNCTTFYGRDAMADPLTIWTLAAIAAGGVKYLTTDSEPEPDTRDHTPVWAPVDGGSKEQWRMDEYPRKHNPGSKSGRA